MDPDFDREDRVVRALYARRTLLPPSRRRITLLLAPLLFVAGAALGFGVATTRQPADILVLDGSDAVLELQAAASAYAAALARVNRVGDVYRREVGNEVAVASLRGLGEELNRLDPSGRFVDRILAVWAPPATTPNDGEEG